MSLILRDYQQVGVSTIRESFKSGRRAPLYVLPTGGGKSAVFSYIAQQAQAKGSRVGILVHRHELLLQASKNLDFFGVEHGLISPKFRATDRPIQVASVQTLARRLEKYPDAFDLIVIDEAHHTLALTWRKIIDANPKAKILGVTATPWRMGGKGLGISAGGVFDELILGPPVRELIDRGFLSKYKAYLPPTDLDLSQVKVTRGDFDSHELEAAMLRPKITGSAVEHYLKFSKGLPAIGFCVSIEHARTVASEFTAAGIRSDYISGEMSDWKRKHLIDSLANGSIEVLTSADLIGEGVDIPVVTTAILLRPTHSLSLYLQQVGRALRPHPSKSHAIILDHVSNALRHGLPDGDRSWSLDDEIRKKKMVSEEIKLRQCPQCYCCHEISPTCPECGHKYASAGEGRSRDIQQEEGELRELNEMELQRLRHQKKIEVAKAKTREDLERIAAERGYKRGWVDNILKFRGNKNATR
jgi:DNA repair protein RadD